MGEPVKSYEKLRMLPVGKAVARGWIREQLLRSKDGMGGHLDELEPDMIANPYITHQTNEGWEASVKAGWGAEISGNYYFGLIALAFALDDAELKAKAERWVDGVLKNQRPDGYIGTYVDGDDLMDDYNAWGTGCGIQALQLYHEATGRQDVLDAVHRGLLWFCEHWAGERKTRYGGQALIINMAWCYLHTGDKRLADFIDDYCKYLDERDIYQNSMKAMRAPELIYNSFHAAGMTNLPKYAAAAYMATGRSEYLEAGTNLVRKIADKMLLPTGGVSSNTEYMSPITSTTETEYCSYTFYQDSLQWMTAVTGNATYMDSVERIAFNGGQGARKKDEKAIAYFTGINQLFATAMSDMAARDGHVYAPCYPISCCPVGSVWTVPNYLHGMGMTDREGNPYVAAYGPAALDFGALKIEMDSGYPFEEEVILNIVTVAPVEKTLHLRLPGWCQEAQLWLNGEPYTAEKTSDGWLVLCRTWNNGDCLRLHLPMQVKISRLNDGDAWQHYPLVVEYGPLVFSLPVPEIWKEIEGNPRTPLPEGWHWYEVRPHIPYDESGDTYEQMGLRKYNVAWNVALSEALDPTEVSVERHQGGYVWEHPPLTLRVPGYRALYAYSPSLENTQEVYQAPIDVQGETILELVPYGCTALRITCFPRANLDVCLP